MPIELVSLAVADASDLTTAAIMDVMQEGGEGATRQVYSTEPVDLTIEDGQLLRDVHDVSVLVANIGRSSQEATLKSLVQNQTNVLVSGYTIDGHILQGHGYLSYKRGFGEVYQTDIVSLGRRGMYGYDSVLGESRMGLELTYNALDLYDSSSGNGAHLFSMLAPSSDMNATEANGVQTIERIVDATTSSMFSIQSYFPFASVTLEASIFVESVAGSGVFAIQCTDSSGAFVDSVSTNITSTGLKSVTMDLGPSCASVRISVRPGSNAGNTVSFRSPQITMVL